MIELMTTVPCTLGDPKDDRPWMDPRPNLGLPNVESAKDAERTPILRAPRLLILGGTSFVGRALTEAALAAGHTITLFNRGTTNPGLFPTVEHLRGDRTNDLSALKGRTWDAVVDVAAYAPEVVRLSTEALRDSGSRYVFVSTVSVYTDQSVPRSEHHAVIDEGDSYGARKAACERIVSEVFGDQATIVRPGLIVGPHDPTNRFSYWPKRIAQGGRVLCPGSSTDPLQFIDVRDLANFIVKLIADDRTGTLNAVGPIIDFGELVRECQFVTGSEPECVWVPTVALLEAGVSPWMGVPLWIAVPGWEAAYRVDVTRAVAAGLEWRPLRDTVKAAWQDTTASAVTVGLSPEDELALLARLA